MLTPALSDLSAAGPAASRAPSAEALRQAAREFESLFTQMMLQSMRATDFGGDLMGQGGEMYRDMLDQEFAKHIGGSGGLGIADMLTRQLQQALPAGAVDSDAATAAPALRRFRGAVAIAETGDAAGAVSPEGFVARMLPLARHAAAKLGVDPAVLVAQAALESGWGGSAAGHNLFGIKADAGWGGAVRTAATHEYVDGRAVAVDDAFRAYPGPADSFADYVDFLRTNPRYAGALDAAGDADAFLDRLQQAGYATDPAYADKVRGILQSDRFRQALAAADSAPVAL